MRSSLLSGSALILSALFMTGCSGISNTAAPSQLTLSGLHGVLHGGQQPVTQSSIQLYQVGTSGYGAGAVSLLRTPVTSDNTGSFTLTGDYTCTVGTQLYITATGGNPGLTAGTNNSALAMMAGLGLCNNLAPSTYIFIDEITTVGAVWALSPFMTGTAASVTIGAPTTNQSGLATAFTDIAQIANNTTGNTPGPMLPAGAVAPTTEINTLADILAGCINSAGPSSTGCAALFAAATPAGGTAPANTIAAALNIARNPGQNVATLNALALPTSPYQPTLVLPNDFTLGVTYPVGSAPGAVALDAASNVWVANSGSSSVTKLSRSGTSATYTSGGVNLPMSIAIDSGGNAWVANSNNSLTELSPSGSGTNFTGNGLNSPRSVAIDGLGMVWVANGGAATLSTFSATGGAVSGSPFATTPANGTGEVAVGINPR